MSENLEFTGERFTPECEREIWYEHMHRYALAAQWCAGARVLDAACGEGYGTAILAGTAAQVVGVDVSPEAIDHARKRYGDRQGLEFREADCTNLPFGDDEFQVVVSFETLEHLSQHDELLEEFRRVLSPGGFLVISSPDKAEYTDRREFENEFHQRELYREEFEALVSRHFPASRILGQKLMFHSVIWAPGEASKVFTQTAGEGLALSAGQLGHAPTYLIALCAAAHSCLPELPASIHLFDDDDESVYTHYHHEIQKNMAAGGVLEGHEERIRALQEQLNSSRRPWWRRLFGGG